MTMTFDQAIAQRDSGMQQALEHAEDVTPDWGKPGSDQTVWGEV